MLKKISDGGSITRKHNIKVEMIEFIEISLKNIVRKVPSKEKSVVSFNERCYMKYIYGNRQS